MRRFRVPEIVLGFGLGIIAFLFVAGVASYQTEHCGQYQQASAEGPNAKRPIESLESGGRPDQKPTDYYKRHPIACGIVGVPAAFVGYMDEHEGFFVGVFTGLLFAATVLLWRATNALWDAGERQIRMTRITSQQQIQEMRQSNLSTRRAAEAAIRSADHIPRTERAYLFLALEVESRIVAFQSGLEDTRSYVKFGFKNHGKTPAIIEELHVMAGFWGASWPAMEAAEKMVIQKGWAVSAGETQGDYSTEFSLRMDHITRARENNGYILFWGKVVYRDVFKELHESGWCRAYHFESEGWRFAGDETLNYYT
jgi:hypothetical protein